MNSITVNVNIHSIRDDEVIGLRTLEGDFVTNLELSPRSFIIRFCLKTKSVLDCKGISRDLALKVSLESINENDGQFHIHVPNGL